MGNSLIHFTLQLWVKYLGIVVSQVCSNFIRNKIQNAKPWRTQGIYRPVFLSFLQLKTSSDSPVRLFVVYIFGLSGTTGVRQKRLHKFLFSSDELTNSWYSHIWNCGMINYIHSVCHNIFSKSARVVEEFIEPRCWDNNRQ